MLSRVDVTEETLLTCMNHALSTEGEEVMGLLLGDIQYTPEGETVKRIWMAYPQIRMDRRKDRVETSPEQMARSSAHADRLSRETGISTRIVGWYHSHPHITVLPSHVDVRTQAMYQMLDENFIGLIFSVFNGDTASRTNRIQVTAFQSAASGSAAAGGTSSLVTVDSADLAGLDSPTAQAIRASAASMVEKQGSLVRRQVPLCVVGPRNAVEQNLLDYVVLQRILFMEEQKVFQGAMHGREAGGRTPDASALEAIHHGCAYQQGLCQLLGTCVAPALASMSSAAWGQRLRARQLRRQNELLKERIAEVTHVKQQRQQQQQQQQQEVDAAAEGSCPAAAPLSSLSPPLSPARPPPQLAVQPPPQLAVQLPELAVQAAAQTQPAVLHAAHGPASTQLPSEGGQGDDAGPLLGPEGGQGPDVGPPLGPEGVRGEGDDSLLLGPEVPSGPLPVVSLEGLQQSLNGLQLWEVDQGSGPAAAAAGPAPAP